MRLKSTLRAAVVGVALLASRAIPQAGPFVAKGAGAFAVEGVESLEILATIDAADLPPPYTAQTVWDDTDIVHVVGTATVIDLGTGRFAVAGRQLMEEEGIFLGTVTISDSAGGSTPVRCVVRAGQSVPVLRDVTLEVAANRTATLAGSYSDTTDEFHTLLVDWGDGEVDSFDLGEEPQGDFAKTHVYSAKAAAKLRAARPRLHVVVTVEDTGGTPSRPEVLPRPLASLGPYKPKLSADCKGTPGGACFLEQLSRDVLGRKPTPGELTKYGGDVATPDGRVATATKLLRSRTARIRWVMDAYAPVLGRRPRTGERDAALATLDATAASEDTVLSELVGSEEYFDRSGGSDAAFVRAVAQTLLGRAADPGHFELFGATIGDGGGKRTSFALAVIGSDEARLRRVNSYYQQYLRRPADSGGASTAMEAIAAGADSAATIAILVGRGDEYQAHAGRFAPPPRATEGPPLDWNEIAFSLLGRPVSGEQLASVTDLVIDPFNANRLLPAILLGHPLHLQRAVDETYWRLLDRAPSASEMSAATDVLQAGGGIDQVQAEILGSAEYFAGHGGGTPAGFVAALVRDDVGSYASQPDPGWCSGLLDAGVSRLDVATYLLGSPSAMDSDADRLSRSFLGHGADPAAASALVSAMQAGSTDEAVTAAIVGSDESFRSFTRPPAGIRRRSAAKGFLGGVHVGLGITFPGLAGDDKLTLLARRDGRRLVTLRIARSAEALEARAADLVSRLMGGTIAAAGPLAALQQGASEEAVITSILSSPEYFDRAHLVATGTAGASTGADLVDAIHLHLLGRVPTQAEFALVTAPVADDPSSAAPLAVRVASSVLASREFRTRFLDGLSDTVLGRAASDAERRVFVDSGLRIGDMRVAFLASQEQF